MGVYISKSTGNVVINNTVSGNQYGLFLDEFTAGTVIVNNIVEGNEDGLYFSGENGVVSKNVIHGNTVSNNKIALSLFYSRDNTFYHNNFINNSNLFHIYKSVERWDYGGEGNFWSNFNETDFFSGPFQNYTGSDGIGDTPYLIDENNVDNYPLFGLFLCFAVEWESNTYDILVISNSTILEFSFVQKDKLIALNVCGGPATAGGFCKVSLPNTLLGGPYTVFVDGAAHANLVEISNDTHSFFYISYGLGIHEIRIEGTTVVQEFSSSLLAFVLFCALAVLLFAGAKKPLAEPKREAV
jgi:parallel beta-helix repeat protein